MEGLGGGCDSGYDADEMDEMGTHCTQKYVQEGSLEGGLAKHNIECPTLCGNASRGNTASDDDTRIVCVNIWWDCVDEADFSGLQRALRLLPSARPHFGKWHQCEDDEKPPPSDMRRTIQRLCAILTK